MYLFLANLSFTDLFFVTNTIPKTLVNLQSQDKAISYTGCLTQLYFLVCLVTLDNLILATMAYDRYVAICRPLHYETSTVVKWLRLHAPKAGGPGSLPGQRKRLINPRIALQQPL